ncbi:DMT family transporter [Dyella subtropica]|uniref:DMT family transporter n=1 Tax=Dyella subtropica TaxID=2992127 RepID=UPI002255D1D8|nr:DMT family transporter [Dyella subtropica]
MSEQARGTAEMSVAMAIAGTIGWFVVTSGRQVLDVVFWRCAFGAVALFVACAYLGHFRGHLTKRVLGLATLGGIAIVLNWILLFAAYSRASIAMATMVYNTQPFMLVCLGAYFLRERVTMAKLAWLALAFGGLALIVQVGASSGPQYTVGIVMAFGAACAWAVAALVTKQLAGTPPHLIALIHVCVGVVALMPFADLAHPPSSAGTWGMLLTIGVVHTGLVYILMYDAIHRLPTHIQGSLSFIYPIVAIAVDVLAFGRRLQTMQVVGSVAILIAVFGMNGLGAFWARRSQADSASHA